MQQCRLPARCRRILLRIFWISIFLVFTHCNGEHANPAKETIDEAHNTKPTLAVGDSLYHQPFEKVYGGAVAKVLNLAPSSLSDPSSLTAAEQLLDLATWYFQLGATHLAMVKKSKHVIQSDNYGQEIKEKVERSMLVDVELASNALTMAVVILRDKEQVEPVPTLQTQIPDNLKNEFLAMVSFQLAELSFDQPSISDEEALNMYRVAQEHYELMLQEIEETMTSWTAQYPFPHKTDYAKACMNVGRIIMDQLHPSNEMLPTWISMMECSQRMEGDSSLAWGYPEALAALQKAVNTYEELLLDRHQYSLSDADWISIEINYVSALQHAASAILVSGDIQQARNYLSKSMEFIVNNLLARTENNLNRESLLQIRTLLAEGYFSLSDVCTHLGDYSCAKDSYKSSMDTYAKYNLQSASKGMVFEQEALEEMNQAILNMEEVRSEFAASNEKRTSLEMADLLSMLSTAYFRIRRFQKSMDSAWAALDMNRILHGEGVNPYASRIQ